MGKSKGWLIVEEDGKVIEKTRKTKPSHKEKTCYKWQAVKKKKGATG